MVYMMLGTGFEVTEAMVPLVMIKPYTAAGRSALSPISSWAKWI